MSEFYGYDYGFDYGYDSYGGCRKEEKHDCGCKKDFDPCKKDDKCECKKEDKKVPCKPDFCEIYCCYYDKCCRKTCVPCRVDWKCTPHWYCDSKK